MNMRIIVVVIVYAFVAVFAPKQHDISRFFDYLMTIDPTIALIISGVATVMAGVGSFILWRQPNGPMRIKPTRVLFVVHMGLIGVIFAGAFDLFYALAGESTNIVQLILIPVAFMIAESVYLILEWRLNRPPEDFEE